MDGMQRAIEWLLGAQIGKWSGCWVHGRHAKGAQRAYRGENGAVAVVFSMFVLIRQISSETEQMRK